MKNLQTFEDFINESISNADSSILDKAYNDGTSQALKSFKNKFLKGEDFETGGIIHIHGSIKGSLAVETRIIDVYHFDIDDPEVVNKSYWKCVDSIQKGGAVWTNNMSKNTDIPREVENTLNKGKYDSSDYTDQFIVIYENPDVYKKDNIYILK